MRRVLILGAEGQLGAELRRCWPDAVALARTQCDFTDLSGLRRQLQALKPGLILNAAAFTAVDRAEEVEGLAHQVNALAPGVLAEEAARLGAPLVHYSTDYVFDGQQTVALTEDHPPAPLNAYGRSKLAGEQAIQRQGGSHLILRTSWVYSAQGHNFVRTILRLASTQHTLRIVDDQTGSPTWARDLADATYRACHFAETAGWTGVSGLYHLSAEGETTWHGLAGELLNLAVRHGVLRGVLPELVPVSSQAYAAKASRPARSVLCNDRFHARFGFRLPHWRSALERFFADGAVPDGRSSLP